MRAGDGRADALGGEFDVPAAVGAGGDVDGKDPLEPLRPAHRTALLLGAARLVVGADVHWRRIARRPLAAPRGRQLRTQVCIRGEYAVEAGEMRARWRDQCRQLGDEVRGCRSDEHRIGVTRQVDVRHRVGLTLVLGLFPDRLASWARTHAAVVPSVSAVSAARPAP